MIQIKVKEEKEEIKEIVISGHSMYEESGKDIVCASVSSIVITSVNAMLRQDPQSIIYEEEDGYLKITVEKQDEVISMLLTNLLELLTELQTQYSKHIKIIK